MYGTAYVVVRLVLRDVPPATLALARLLLGIPVLWLFARRAGPGAPLSRADGLRVAGMGVVGFAAAYALTNWGIARSTATNAALLITLEPVSLMVLAPLALGERPARREVVGGILAVAGALLIVADGIPGLTTAVTPHWRGDVLVLLAALAYGSYSLLGRSVLARHGATPVTVRSILWGVPALVPLAAAEWAGGARPDWTARAVVGTLYLAVVITALGYLAWNWALERITASSAAVFLNVQPAVGAGLGIGLLGEPASAFVVLGAVLVLGGLWLTMRSG